MTYRDSTYQDRDSTSPYARGVQYYRLGAPPGGGLAVPWGSPLELMLLYQNMQKNFNKITLGNVHKFKIQNFKVLRS